MPTTLLLFAPIGLPLLAAVSQATGGGRRWSTAVGVATSVLLLTAAAALAGDGPDRWRRPAGC